MENFDKLSKLNECSLFYNDYVKNKAKIKELTNKNNSILIRCSKLILKISMKYHQHLTIIILKNVMNYLNK